MERKEVVYNTSDDELDEKDDEGNVEVTKQGVKGTFREVRTQRNLSA